MNVSHPNRWTLEEAQAWSAQQPWLVGCNYCPAYAINQLEMWQSDTFDPAAIDRELGWAANLGFNSLRVFLHDLLWQDCRTEFLDRIDRFLGLAKRHSMNVMPVLFDSVWHPFPRLGPQRDPEPFVHNSGWVQSPGVEALRDPQRFASLQPYVQGLIRHFADDPRIVAWDLWNEPDNVNASSYGPRDLGDAKAGQVLPLLKETFSWARSAQPTQPLLSGPWRGDWSHMETCNEMEQAQFQLQDLTSFHCYSNSEKTLEKILALKKLRRPLLCTEFMARSTGDTFADILPLFKEHRVAAYCWGLVQGRTQTHMPWDSWSCRYDAEPAIWHHDVLRPDGSPFDASEVELIRQLLH